MKTNFLVSFVTVIAVLACMSLVVAANSLDVDVYKVEIDRADVSGNNVALVSGNTIDLDLFFVAGEDAEEVEISAWIQGYRSDGAEQSFADLIDGKDYHSTLSLAVPSDLDNVDEEHTISVRIETDSGSWEEEFQVNIQRESYKVDLLFVEVDQNVKAGQSVPVDVVIKNLGRHELDDVVVSVSVPELGISKNAYFGDLTPTDNSCDKEDFSDDDEYLACLLGDDNDAEDTYEKRIYLNIPEDTATGTYELKVEAYNSDEKDMKTISLSVQGKEDKSKLVVAVTSKEVAVGNTVTYDVMIVNSGSNIGVYQIVAETAEGVLVTVDSPVVTVAAGSSQVVKVSVKGVKEGTYSFGVNVIAEDGSSERAGMTALVTEGKVSLTGNVAVLTIILAIVFVVLLVVLIVLLTRKPQQSEELEESYY